MSFCQGVDLFLQIWIFVLTSKWHHLIFRCNIDSYNQIQAKSCLSPAKKNTLLCSKSRRIQSKGGSVNCANQLQHLLHALDISQFISTAVSSSIIMIIICADQQTEKLRRWFQIYFALYLSIYLALPQSPSLASSNYVCTHTHTCTRCTPVGCVQRRGFAHAEYLIRSSTCPKRIRTYRRVKRLLIESKLASAARARL
jgi:hypothetical protein